MHIDVLYYSDDVNYYDVVQHMYICIWMYYIINCEMNFMRELVYGRTIH